MLRILLLALLFVGLYRFMTRFVFPLLRITSAVRGQMRNMHQATAPPQTEHTSPRKPRKGDYIDFEEVK